jgi:hypothetical protein
MRLESLIRTEFHLSKCLNKNLVLLQFEIFILVSKRSLIYTLIQLKLIRKSVLEYKKEWNEMKCKYLMYILTNYFKLRLTNDRPDLSSETAPYRDKTATFR